MQKHWQLFVLICGAWFSTVASAEAFLLSEKTYRALEGIHQQMENQQYTQAEQTLLALARETTQAGYDQAIIQQTLGFLYAEQGKNPQAIDAFRLALRQDALPEAVAHTLRFNLGQLLIATERFEEGVTILEAWLKQEAQPADNIFLLLASAYYRLPNYPKVVSTLDTLIQRPGAVVQEDWLRMQLAALLEMQQYPAAITVLEQLVQRFPEQAIYWEQLAALYLREDQDFRALAVHTLAQKMALTDSNTVLRIIDLYRYVGIPLKAAQWLEQGIERGDIERSLTHLQRLADSWTAAREPEKAIAVLEQMTSLDASGRIELRLARLFVAEEQWQAAQDVLARGLEKLTDSDWAEAQLLLGLARANLSDFSGAHAALSAAMRDPKHRDQAAQWLRYVDRLAQEAEHAS